jgi:hypothetical protein
MTTGQLVDASIMAVSFFVFLGSRFVIVHLGQVGGSNPRSRAWHFCHTLWYNDIGDLREGGELRHVPRHCL